MRNVLILSTMTLLFIGCGESSSSSSSSVDSGQGGSMARFAIAGDYLYTINEREMNVLDISNASTPKKENKIHVPFDVETLFSYKETLYVGSSSGMYIYDNSTPTLPTRVAEFSHAQSCDPVVVSDDVAYVTLSSSSTCWRGTGVNRLEIVDVKTPDKPKLIRAIDMWEPKGLGVDGTNLFICDGSNGLKVFDLNKTDNNGTIDVTIASKENLGDVDCYDVISQNNHLIISNRDDIRQFDYSSFPMEELGRIK